MKVPVWKQLSIYQVTESMSQSIFFSQFISTTETEDAEEIIHS